MEDVVTTHIHKVIDWLRGGMGDSRAAEQVLPLLRVAEVFDFGQLYLEKRADAEVTHEYRVVTTAPVKRREKV